MANGNHMHEPVQIIQHRTFSPMKTCRRQLCVIAHLGASSAIVPGAVGVADFFVATGSSSGVASKPFGEPPAPHASRGHVQSGSQPPSAALFTLRLTRDACSATISTVLPSVGITTC